jgi:phosphotransferase system  glucose/maltose/N-acetylglucosamine-specific IIC component
MPIISTVIIAGILLGFSAFAVALIWADIQTGRARRSS